MPAPAAKAAKASAAAPWGSKAEAAESLEGEEAAASADTAQGNAMAPDAGDSAGFADPAWRPMQWLPRLKIFRNPLAGFSFRAEDRGSFLHLCLEHLHITGNPQADAARLR